MRPTDSEALALLGRIHDERLDAPPRFFGLALSQVQAAYNGIGPDRFPDLLTEFTSRVLFAIWAPDAMIHDCDYVYFNDGSSDAWHEANRRFRANGLRSIRANIPAWRFLERWYHYRVNDALFAAVESSQGWTAWRDAYEKYNPPEPGPEVMA